MQTQNTISTSDITAINTTTTPDNKPLNKKQRAAANRAIKQQQSLTEQIATLQAQLTSLQTYQSITNPPTTPNPSVHTSPADTRTSAPIIPDTSSFNAPLPDIAKQNLATQQRRDYANLTHSAEGILVIINNEDNTTTYGFEDLKVWVPRTQTWDLLTSQNPDAFMVTCETQKLASSEFYQRWQTFCQKTYKSRIFITALNYNNNY